MKTLTRKSLSILLMLCIGISMLLTSCTNIKESENNDLKNTNGYFTLDINPSVEFIVRDGKVAKVKAANDDASVVLSGEDFIGLTVEQASEKITKLSEQMGYLNESNNQVKINVISSDTESKEKMEASAKEGATNGSEIAKVSTTTRAHENRVVKDLQKQDPELYKDLTAEKVRLIESIIKYDSTMTYEIGAAMKIEELLDIREDLMDEYEDMISEELEDKFDAKYDERKQAVEDKIAGVYADAYAKLHSDVSSARDDFMQMYFVSEKFDRLFDRFEEENENQTLKDEDIEAVIKLLSDFQGSAVEKNMIADENGNVNEDTIENYIDKKIIIDEDNEELEDKLDALEDALDEILDRYDEDNCTLTDDQIIEIMYIVIEYKLDVDFTSDMTFEEIEEILEQFEETYEEYEEEVEDKLTKEQEAEIEKFEKEKDSIKEQIREEMKDEIQAEIDRIAAEKAEKLKK